MRKLSFYLSVLFAAFAFLSACEQQDIDPVAVQENNVADGLTKVNFTYSVHVVPSSERGRVEGLSGAMVTVSQNGNAQSKTTNADGMAIFANLQPGDVTVFVEANGFASQNVVKVGGLTPTSAENADNVDRNQEVTLSRALEVKLPLLGAGVKGSFFYDNDLDDATPLVAASGFRVAIMYPSTTQPSVYYGTVGSDGSLQVSNLPDGRAFDTGDITYAIDTTIKIGNRFYTYSANGNISPKVGDHDDLGVINCGVTAASGTEIDKSGRLVMRPWGYFDFKIDQDENNDADWIPQTDNDLKLPSSVTVYVDFSGSSSYMSDSKGLEPVMFSATPDATGKLTWSNLPTGYDFEVKYQYLKQIPIVSYQGNFYVDITDDEWPKGKPNASSISSIPNSTSWIDSFDGDKKTAFTLEVMFDGMASFNKSSLDKNEVRDLGFIQFSE